MASTRLLRNSGPSTPPCVLRRLSDSSHLCWWSPSTPARKYHAASAAVLSPYSPAESAILSAALTHVPQSGFTSDALAHGARDAGYRSASANLFPRGPFEMVLFHLVTQRLALKDAVQFPEPPEGSRPLGVGAKVRALVRARLQANAAIQPSLSEALALMSLAGNIPASLAELARLVDEIRYLAGDASVDSSWYTKRAMLAAAYTTSEVFMSQDTSPDFRDTAHFADRRLDDATSVGSAARDVGQWLGFTGIATVNVLRSWGAKI